MEFWRPGLRVWWRRDGEAQIGLDPPTILFGLTRADHTLLEALARADPQIDCWTVARRLGWKREAYLAFIARLPAHAVVGRPTKEATPAARYWSLVAATGSAHGTDRGSAAVIVDGVDRLGLLLVDAIAGAGLGTVYLHDGRAVAPHDLHPGGYLADDVGRPRARNAVHRLRPRHPQTQFYPARPPEYAGAVREEQPPRAPEEKGRPPQGRASRAGRRIYEPLLRGAHHGPAEAAEGVDLAVVVGDGAITPRRIKPYAALHTPVLPVTVGELDIAVGPLLAPPGPCLRCVHLHLTDADARWPALATQLAAEANPGIDPVVSQLAASVAGHQVTAIADGRPTAVAGVSLHVDGLHPVPRFRRWERHPRCGCALDHLAA